MKRFVDVARLCARIVATPPFVICFGFFWLGFMVFLGPMFAAFSFLANEHFGWKAHIADCNEFFCEPFVQMWGGQ